MDRVTIAVAGAGLQTTVQDLGRPLHQRDAVPAGGAMDRIALRAANLLVGNEEGAAGLETTLIGPTLQFEQQALIAVTGADLEATVDGRAIPLWRPLLVPARATLRFGRAERGCRAYIAVAGGIDVPTVFGSRSTYLRAQFGGLEGRALRAGDRLAVAEPGRLSRAIAASLAQPVTAWSAGRWSFGQSLRPAYSDDAVVRILDGAHTSGLDDTSRVALTEKTFRISASSDRMGYRLEGNAITLTKPTELLSEAVAFGTIQLPPGGAPIILMADRQTTGGYPRIGEVASVDLPLVAQLKPADRLRFRRISLAEAERLYLEQEYDMTQARMAVSLRFSRG